jgi:hypothetical protein
VLFVGGLAALVTGIWIWCGAGPGVTTAGVGLAVLGIGVALGHQGGQR